LLLLCWWHCVPTTVRWCWWDDGVQGEESKKKNEKTIHHRLFSTHRVWRVCSKQQTKKKRQSAHISSQPLSALDVEVVCWSSTWLLLLVLWSRLYRQWWFQGDEFMCRPERQRTHPQTGPKKYIFIVANQQIFQPNPTPNKKKSFTKNGCR